jgi:hypothetical protein
MRWRGHKVASLEITGPANEAVKLRYGDTSRTVALDAGGRYRI